MKLRIFWLSFIIAILIFRADLSLAGESNNILDGMVFMYRDAASAWQTVILEYASRLFWLLVAIDLSWLGISLALKRADFSEIVSELIKRVMIVGFYLALLQNSYAWSQAIVASFRSVADAANGSLASGTEGISPSNIFDIGLRIAGALSDQVSFSDPAESLARVFTGLIVIVAFSLIAGLLLVALIEMYIALSAGVILLGFGGSRWTSDYATKYMSYVVSVGVKLFSMQLLIGIGQSFILKFFEAYQPSNTQSLIFIGVALVLLLLIKSIPDTLQGLINGASFGGGGNMLLTGASAAVGGALGAATAGTAMASGGAMAVFEAAKLASSESRGPASLLKGTVKNLAGSALSDMGGKLAGNYGSRHGTLGGRMASRLREERLSRRPPSVNGDGKTDDSP